MSGTNNTTTHLPHFLGRAYHVVTSYVDHPITDSDTDSESDTEEAIHDLVDESDLESDLDESDVIAPIHPLDETIANYDETILADLYGDVLHIELLDYHRYKFTLLVTTTKYEIKIVVGGNASDIYNFEIWVPEWSAIKSAGIRELNIIGKLK